MRSYNTVGREGKYSHFGDAGMGLEGQQRRAATLDPEHHVFTFGDMHLHYAAMGDADAPLLLCLHGFPEYWGAWRDLMPLLAERFRVVAPDQRGYGKSAKPEGVEAYQTRHLVADMAALANHLSPDRPLLLFGHDWGASVAYAYAFRYPDRLLGLVIANGVHPVTFQRAIIEDPQQRAASQYMSRLREDGFEARMQEDGFARTLNMIEGFSAAGWMGEATRQAYRGAWSGEGTMTAMLNWYRASPVVVPPTDVPVQSLAGKVPVLDLPADAVRVRVPHLVIWGERDEALRPSCLGGLERYAADLTIHKTPAAGHWILHERPGEVAETVVAWATGKALL